MPVINFPSNLYVKSLRWERFDQDVTFRGPFGVQSVAQISALWKLALTFDLRQEYQAGPYQALMMLLEGTRNQLAMWNIGRPVPLGTFTGAAGTTTIGTTAAGATSVVLTNANYLAKTILAGDYIGIINGSDTLTQQVVMATSSVTSNGSGVITVDVMPPVRYAITAGSTVTLQQPKALFRQQTTNTGWTYETVNVDSMTLDLLEDTRP